MSERLNKLVSDLIIAIREEVSALPEQPGLLSAEIKKARLSAHLSLQQVANAAGATKSHIWELEQGRTKNPTISMVAGLSTALGMPFIYLAAAALNEYNTSKGKQK